MNFEEKKDNKLGKIVGYLLMYFIFSTVLYLILNYRFPEKFSYVLVLSFTTSLLILSTIIKFWMNK